jgi:hypothetical protein
MVAGWMRAQAAPVSEVPPGDPERPVVVPWSDARPAHPVSEMLGGAAAGGPGPALPVDPPDARQDIPAAGGTAVVAPAEPIRVDPPAAADVRPAPGADIAASLPPATRLDSTAPLRVYEPPDEYWIEAIAVGMIAAGGLVGAAAWYKLGRRKAR